MPRCGATEPKEAGAWYSLAPTPERRCVLHAGHHDGVKRTPCSFEQLEPTVGLSMNGRFQAEAKQ